MNKNRGGGLASEESRLDCLGSCGRDDKVPVLRGGNFQVITIRLVEWHKKLGDIHIKMSCMKFVVLRAFALI